MGGVPGEGALLVRFPQPHFLLFRVQCRSSSFPSAPCPPPPGPGRPRGLCTPSSSLSVPTRLSVSVFAVRPTLWLGLQQHLVPSPSLLQARLTLTPTPPTDTPPTHPPTPGTSFTPLWCFWARPCACGAAGVLCRRRRRPPSTLGCSSPPSTLASPRGQPRPVSTDATHVSNAHARSFVRVDKVSGVLWVRWPVTM